MYAIRSYYEPVLVETFLPGREFTVGIVGNDAQTHSIGIMEVVLLKNSDPDVYSYHNKEFCDDLVEYRVVDDPEARMAVELSIACYKALGCVITSYSIHYTKLYDIGERRNRLNALPSHDASPRKDQNRT